MAVAVAGLSLAFLALALLALALLAVALLALAFLAVALLAVAGLALALLALALLAVAGLAFAFLALALLAPASLVLALLAVAGLAFAFLALALLALALLAVAGLAITGLALALLAVALLAVALLAVTGLAVTGLAIALVRRARAQRLAGKRIRRRTGGGLEAVWLGLRFGAGPGRLAVPVPAGLIPAGLILFAVDAQALEQRPDELPHVGALDRLKLSPAIVHGRRRRGGPGQVDQGQGQQDRQRRRHEGPGRRGPARGQAMTAIDVFDVHCETFQPLQLGKLDNLLNVEISSKIQYKFADGHHPGGLSKEKARPEKKRSAETGPAGLGQPGGGRKADWEQALGGECVPKGLKKLRKILEKPNGAAS